jgi:hypothetical protein
MQNTVKRKSNYLIDTIKVHHQLFLKLLAHILSQFHFTLGISNSFIHMRRATIPVIVDLTVSFSSDSNCVLCDSDEGIAKVGHGPGPLARRARN